jgi:hypothetical protein
MHVVGCSLVNLLLKNLFCSSTLIPAGSPRLIRFCPCRHLSAVTVSVCTHFGRWRRLVWLLCCSWTSPLCRRSGSTQGESHVPLQLNRCEREVLVIFRLCAAINHYLCTWFNRNLKEHCMSEWLMISVSDHVRRWRTTGAVMTTKSSSWSQLVIGNRRSHGEVTCSNEYYIYNVFNRNL